MQILFNNFQPFGPILHLVPLAESVVKLSAVCMNCFKDAAFTKRLGQEKQVCSRKFDVIPLPDNLPGLGLTK